MTDTPRLRIGLIGVGLVLLIATALYFAMSNSPAADATPDSTTTTLSPTTSTTVELPFEATGVQFDWAETLTFTQRNILGIHQIDDTIYLFASHELDGGRHPMSRGLDAWVTADGVTWTHQENLIDGNYQVDLVIESSHGLTAVGGRPATNTVMVWHSNDAENWSRHQAATFERDGALWRHTTRAVAGADAFLAVVETDTSEEGGGSIYDDLLAEIYGPVFGRHSIGGASARVTVLGPLDMPIAAPLREDLPLDGVAPGQPALGSWIPRQLVSSDGVEWHQPEGETFVGSSEWFDGPDGRIWRMTRIDGILTSATSDGVNWEDVSASQDGPWFQRPQTWGDNIVALDLDRDTGTGAMISADGGRWDELDPGTLFDTPQSWTTEVIAAGDRGLAAIVRPHPATHVAREAEFEHDGYTIRVHRVYVEITDPAGETVQEITRGGDFDPDAMDVEATWITFKHRHTGEALFTIGVDRLWEIDRTTRRGPTADNTIFVFTPDGEEWTIQDFSHVISNEDDNRMLRLVGDLAVCVVDTADGGVKVWTAPVPGATP